MKVIAISLDDTHTGIVRFDGMRVTDSLHIEHKGRLHDYNDALQWRVWSFWNDIENYIDTHEHDKVVLLGYDRHDASSAAPENIGFVHGILTLMDCRVERYDLETFTHVVSSRNHPEIQELWMRMECYFDGTSKVWTPGYTKHCSNHQCLRKAFILGYWYLTTKAAI